MAHVLIVDDDKDILDTLQDTFILFGHMVTTAVNGQQAYEIFRNKDGKVPDIAIIDVEMPLMNGIDLTRRIKEINQTFPVILITAYSHLYRPQDVLNLDIEAFLKKPLNLKGLVKVVERIMESKALGKYSGNS